MSLEQEISGGFPGGKGVVARRGGVCAVLCPCYAALQCNPCITSNRRAQTSQNEESGVKWKQESRGPKQIFREADEAEARVTQELLRRQILSPK